MDDPFPFEELFRPLVLDAENRLRERIDAAAWDLLTPEAHQDWTRYLLSRILTAGSRAVHWQFQIYQSVRHAFATGAHGTRWATDTAYRQFVGPQPKERLQKLFNEFPALAQLCTVLIENWLAAVTEFFARLQADHRELPAHFPDGRFACPVVRLQPGLSDSHHGGRSVVRLNFIGGASVVYKPRSLIPETHFATLLDQLNASGNPHPLKSARCWDRGIYGWMEDVVAGPCSVIDEVHRFYWRAGVLLGICYLAHGVDFHRENLIAAGQHPILIDLETLWHPQNRFGSSGLMGTSVMRTGFLPQRGLRKGEHYGWSALTQTGESMPLAPGPFNIDDAQMTQKPAQQKFAAKHHLPVVQDTPCPASDFIDEIEAGFRWAGGQIFGPFEERFKHWRDTLIECPRRLIRRSTAEYRNALRWLTTPQYLRRISGHDASLVQPQLAQSGDPLMPEEVHALEQMDLPYFKQSGDESKAPNAAQPEELTEAIYLAQIPVIADALTNQS